MSYPNDPPPPPGGSVPPGGEPPSGGFGAPPPPPPGGGFPPPPQQPPPPGGGFQPGPAGSQPPSEDAVGSVTAAFQYGWNKFQENIKDLLIAILAWIGVVIVAVVLILILSSIFGSIGGNAGFIGLMITMAFATIFLIVANFVGGVALLRVGLLTTRGERVVPQTLFDTENLVPYILTSLLVGLITAVGYALCFVPGIVAMFFLFFAPYYALDRGMSPVDSLKASFDVVNRNIATTLVLLIGAAIAYTIGSLLCGVGLIVAMPIILIAYAYMYRQFNGEPVAP